MCVPPTSITRIAMTPPACRSNFSFIVHYEGEASNCQSGGARGKKDVSDLYPSVKRKRRIAFACASRSDSCNGATMNLLYAALAERAERAALEEWVRLGEPPLLAAVFLAAALFAAALGRAA